MIVSLSLYPFLSPFPSLPLSFPGYLSLYVVYVIVVIISSFIYQRQKRLMHSSIEYTSGPGYSHKYTQTANKMKKLISWNKHHLHLQCFTLRTPRTMTFPACLMGPLSKNMVDCQKGVCGRGVLFSTRRHVRLYVFQTRSTGRSYLTPSPQVISCWPLWTQWTPGSGGGNRGAGESSKWWRCVGSQITEVSEELCPQRSCCWQTPVEVLLLLCIPVVDPDKEDKNWRRPLNCLHLITAPLVCVLAFQSGVCKCITHDDLHSDTFQKDFLKKESVPCPVNLDGNYKIQGQVPLWLLILLLGLFLSAIVFCSTTNDCPPKYHPVRIDLVFKRITGCLLHGFR